MQEGNDNINNINNLSTLSIDAIAGMITKGVKDNNDKNGIYIKNGNFSYDKIHQIELTQKLTSKKSKQLQHERIPSASTVSTSALDDCMMIKYSLIDINLKIKPTEFVAVIGSVGSGKSSLLSAVLNELPSTVNYHESFIYMNGKDPDDIKIGYAAQKPWILSDSIRNNILFGNEYEEEWYKTVIINCGFDKDISELPYLDETIIGERGMNLSGGQKSRINLARAIYCKPDILLIDDSLSAVDSIVARHIFNNVLSNENGLMKNTIRLFVTHQEQFLPNVDSVIVMKDGQILHHDTFLNIENKINVKELLTLMDKHDCSSDDYCINSKINPNSDAGSFETTESLLTVSSPHANQLDDLLDDEKYNALLERLNNNWSSMTVSPSSLSTIGIGIEIGSEDGNIWDKTPELAFTLNSVQQNMKQKARRHSVVQEEAYQTGGISLETYSSIIYSKYKCIKLLKVVLIIVLMISAQIFLVASEYWLGVWASQSTKREQSNPIFQFVYYLLATITLVLCLWRTTFVFSELLKSCEKLSNEMFHGVLYSPMSFFESNPVGRILNRFSKDCNLMDEKLPVATYDWIESITTCLIVFILAGFANIYLYIVFIPVLLLIIYYGKSFLSSSRVLKRLDAKTRSDIFSLFSMMFNGLDIIRAFKKQQYILEQSLNTIDINTRVYMIYHSCIHWLGFRLDICIFIITSVTAFMCVYIQDKGYDIISSAAVGVTLSYMLLLGKILPWTVRQFATVENIMVSVERIIEYGQLQSEETNEQKKLYLNNKDLLNDWPKNGNIKIENLCVSYRDYLDDILHDINIEIKDCEKIGIVGRTGCGKSTLFLTLFRILNISKGRVMINDIDINRIPLSKLRSSINIIPQNPVLLNDTLKYNIDPFNQYQDCEIYSVLKDIGLFDMICNKLPNRLLTEINECGSNFSVGECQLICIARALLNKKSKILLVDEATSNIDPQTDKVIQNVLKKHFQNKTVLTIAHRLNTILDNDRILVMDKGRIVEFDKPCNLLLKSNGIFAKMYTQINNNSNNINYFC